MKATGYNQMRDDEELLTLHASSVPSFTVRLYPSHWSLNNGPKFLYNMPVSSLLEDIRAYRIPPDFIELFDEANVPYYDGCLIVELLDFRPPKAKDPILETPDTQRVVLRPSAETIWADICQVKQKTGASWTDMEALEMEARILLATSHPLCLEPDPHLTRIVNNVIRVSTPTMPNSLKRKAAPMVDVEEDEAEKAKRAKVLQFMNPQASRATMPVQPGFRILQFLEKRRQETPAQPEERSTPTITMPTLAGAPTNGQAIPSQMIPAQMISGQILPGQVIAAQATRIPTPNPTAIVGMPATPAPPIAPMMTTARSGSVDEPGKKSSGMPTPAQPTVQLPQPQNIHPPVPVNVPISVQTTRQMPDPNARKSPVKRPASVAQSAAQVMPPPQVPIARQPSPAVNMVQQSQPQPIRPPSRLQQQQQVEEQMQALAQQNLQSQPASVQASPQTPSAKFNPPLPPTPFFTHPPPQGKRRQSQAKPPTPAIPNQQLPLPQQTPQPPSQLPQQQPQQQHPPQHQHQQQLQPQQQPQPQPQQHPSPHHQQLQQSPIPVQQSAPSPVVGAQQRAAASQAALNAYSAMHATLQANKIAQAQHAANPQASQQMSQMSHLNPMQLRALAARQLNAGRSTPVAQPGTPQQNHAVLVQSPVLQNQQSGRNTPMIAGQVPGQPIARSSPLVTAQNIPQRVQMPQGAGLQQGQGMQQMSMAQLQYYNHIRAMAARSQMNQQAGMMVQAQNQQQMHPGPTQVLQQTDQTGGVPQQQNATHPQLSMYPQAMMGYQPFAATWMSNAQHSAGQQQFSMVPGVAVRAPMAGGVPNNMAGNIPGTMPGAGNIANNMPNR